MGFVRPLLGICLFASASAWAGLTTGSVQILVEDDDGLTVPGATVELSCENLIGGAQTLVTDANGQVTFVELPPGVCDARIVRDAFENVTVQGLRIDINRLSVQRVAMKAGSSTEIVVEARRPHADVTSTTAGTILTREFLNSVPMARSYQSAVQLAAGVTGGAGGNPNIGGGAYNENTYMREGAYISVPVAGGAVAPNAEQYEHPGFHGTESTAVDRLSTFAIDVDTASYALARVKLRQGQLPDTASVRVEEFVNAFPYDLGPGPRTGAPLGIHTEVAQHPLRQGSVLLSVALQSRQVPTERKPLHLTFLVDVSGSMSSADKIGLVRDSLHRLTDGLGAEDEVAIVTYAGSTQVVLEPTWTTRKGTVHDAIDRLRVGGGTAMGDGLDLAYGMAERMYRDGVENRVIVLTDGDANVGRASTDQLQAIVAKRAGQGIGLSVVGVGQGNYKDARLEQLADKGDGNYHYVDSVDEAARVFGRDLVANLTTLARDVKVQLEFPEEAVVAWRQIGYENREVADEDFRDDAVDGGEVGYGHQVTALYELDLRDHPKGDLVRVAVRAEPPGKEAAAIEFTATHAASDPIGPWEQASPAMRWASATATFAEVLRGAPVESETSWRDVLRLVDGALDRDREDQVEMRELVVRAASLSGRLDGPGGRVTVR